MSSPDVLELDGHRVTVTHPDKVVFPGPGLTKRDLLQYYLTVADGALRGVGDRPMILKRFVKGVEHEAFFQKRAPSRRPPWIRTAELRYRSGTSAEEVVVADVASLAWVVNLGCVDLNPHAVRADDLDHPDELRIDLDPVPGVPWSDVIAVALTARDVLVENGLTPWPKTSGSRGFHVYAPIEPRHSFSQVRSAAHAVAREVARRVPHLATAEWWKEERHGVFVDFNQNAKDRTVASAWSVRPTPDARVSMPLTWDEVPRARPADHTVRSSACRFVEQGDPWGGMHAGAAPLEPLLELAESLGPAPSHPRAPGTRGTGEGRRRPAKPLVEIARAASESAALDALEQWKRAHPAAAASLAPADVLVDRMRGRSSLWYRVRVNLEHVAPEDRPGQETLIVDYDPWQGWPRSL
jgi:bifunctional non-homologous end joining protein LigD